MAKMEDTTAPVKSNNTPYLVAVTIMVSVGILASVLIQIARPVSDNTGLIAAIFGILTPTTVSLLALMKAQETHLSVNSRLDAFIDASLESGRAEGFSAGRTAGQDEANARTDSLAGEFPPQGTNYGDGSDQSLVKTGDKVKISKVKS